MFPQINLPTLNKGLPLQNRSEGWAVTSEGNYPRGYPVLLEQW